LTRKWLTTIAIDPAMESSHVDISFGGKKKGAFAGCAATVPLENTLLPMQEDLVVLENLVVSDVLEPSGPQADQQFRGSGLKLEGKTGKQSAFPPANRDGVNNGENACKSLGCEVMPHQLGCHELGGL
jgi:hypothetical protein